MESFISHFSSELLPAEFLEKYNGTNPKWGFGNLGYIVYKRTYARELPDGSATEEWWQTIARCINGAQKIGADYTAEEAQTLYDHVFNLRCSFAGRMLWQLGTKTVDRFGANSLLNCFGYSTEILTGDGVKPIGSLVDKPVKIMTEYGKWVDANINSYGEQELVNLKLKRGRRITKDVLVTKNHRWFRKPRRSGVERSSNRKTECTTTELQTGDVLVSMYGQSVKTLSELSLYGIAHGLVFGDGSVCNNTGQLTLCGPKNKELLEWFPNHKTYTLKNGDVVVANLPKYFKEKPTLDMDKSYLYGWLAGYFAADGCVSGSGQIRLASATEDNLLFVRDVCVKLGIGYCPITTQSRIGIGQTEPSDLFSITLQGTFLTEEFFLISNHRKRFNKKSFSKSEKWKVVSVEPTGKTETVYCAEVPNTHSFVIEGNILTGNCFYISIRDPEDFCFLFENLMLGGGVGFSVKREDVYDLPKIKTGISVVHENTKDADFIVPDSRQGWIELLRKTLASYFVEGKSFTYSTILVRGSGEPIKGFGGTSSGPIVLIEGIEKITGILDSREGKKLRSLDVLDICNIIGSVVVAGNVRRSALIALGDPDDFLYLRAKRWDLDNIPNWRAMSNNTLYADNYAQISDTVWDGYLGNGEPYGFFNLPLAKKFGRLGEKKKDNCEGLNPCGEISLASGESCNLSEIFMNNVPSKEVMLECAQLLYKTQKAVCAMPFVHDITSEIVHKNMRIGIGVTGICQSMDKMDWLDHVYKEMRQYDIGWSAEKGYNESIKLTTIKPSGTVSLLSGSSPGAHPGYAQYFIRRVRMASNDRLVTICRDMGYPIEFVENFDGSENHDTVVVSFPCKFTEDTLLSKDMSAIEQLELLRKLQTEWSDNAVSMTIYYNKEELPEIKKWMKKNYKTGIKSVSFLLHSDHGFRQAPYEEITETEFSRLVKKVKPISSIMENIELADMEGIECEGGACPIK